MKINFVLIDYESVQPKLLSSLNHDYFRILVFVGENQVKISYELAEAIQIFGDRAKYIKINGNGPNALDFHIAFYIGQVAKEIPDAFFHIISKDKGFDPLIKHLKSLKILCARSQDIMDMPLLKALNSSSKSEKINAIIENLKQRGTSKPRKEKTLHSTINSLFQKNLSSEEVITLIEELKSKSIITISNSNISYHLAD
jgi:hypothetical protein